MIVAEPAWEGQVVRLVALHGLPLQPITAGPLPVTGVVVHQTGGQPHRGLDGVVSLLSHWASRPTYHAGKLAGGGYGRLAPYHFVVPVPVPGTGGKLEVFRVAPETHTHQASQWPLIARDPSLVSVGVCGCYTSRHAQEGLAQPDSLTWVALKELVLDYLLPRYGLGRSSLLGGFDRGRPASPGDAVEQWVRHTRGEAVPDPGHQLVTWPRYPVEWPDGHYTRSMPPDHLAKALTAIGFAPGQPGRYWTDQVASAVCAFQRMAGIPATGVLDVHTDGAIRHRLGQLAWTP
jgi:hypothetical protein